MGRNAPDNVPAHLCVLSMFMFMNTSLVKLYSLLSEPLPLHTHTHNHAQGGQWSAQTCCLAVVLYFVLYMYVFVIIKLKKSHLKKVFLDLLSVFSFSMFLSIARLDYKPKAELSSLFIIILLKCPRMCSPVL